jgi:branched-chain amino acid transport system substrate-binding protein
VHGSDRIAIVFTESTYSRGLAAETKRRLNELGVEEGAFVGVDTASADWTAVADRLGREAVDVIYVLRPQPDTGLLIRCAADLGHRFEVLGGDAMNTEDFWLIAREAGEGTRFSVRV